MLRLARDAARTDFETRLRRALPAAPFEEHVRVSVLTARR